MGKDQRGRKDHIVAIQGSLTRRQEISLKKMVPAGKKETTDIAWP